MNCTGFSYFEYEVLFQAATPMRGFVAAWLAMFCAFNLVCNTASDHWGQMRIDDG